MAAVISRTDLGCNLTCEEITYEWVDSYFEVQDNEHTRAVKRAVVEMAIRRNVSKEDFYQWAVLYGDWFRAPNELRDLKRYWMRLMFMRDEHLFFMSSNISGHYEGISVPPDHWDRLGPVIERTFA